MQNHDDAEAIEQWLCARGYRPLLPLESWVTVELNCLRHNLDLMRKNAEASTAHRRELRAELMALKRALAGLSHDTRSMLVETYGMGELSAVSDCPGYDKLKRRKPIKTPGKDAKIIGYRGRVISADEVNLGLHSFEHAARIALAMMPPRAHRGRGHDAALRRFFAREAGRLYVLATSGKAILSANQDGHFLQWCDLIAATIDAKLPPGTLQRAIQSEIGRTVAEREAWRKAALAPVLRFLARLEEEQHAKKRARREKRTDCPTA